LELIKNILIVSGMLMLLGAVRPVGLLLSDLPSGQTKLLWRVLLALIYLFVGGYLGYLILFWGQAGATVDLIVPAVFFLGALFVLLVCSLSCRTSQALKRMYILEYESTVDSLTGIYNRRQFDRRLREEFSVARRHGQPMSLIMIDADHFKAVNDQLGHQGGDLVLRRLAEILSANVREGDVVCRYGGEEFAVILPQTDASCALTLAERLRHQVGRTELIPENMSPSKSAIHLTISLGVATLAKTMPTAEALVNDADQALYEAKSNGRDRVVLFAAAGQARDQLSIVRTPAG
jgi:diguanylate cyclase (GGDEF)-like protein